METQGPWHRLGRPPQGSLSWVGLGRPWPHGGVRWGRVGHISDSCLFAAVNWTDFILFVLTFREATAGGGAESVQVLLLAHLATSCNF